MAGKLVLWVLGLVLLSGYLCTETGVTGDRTGSLEEYESFGDSTQLLFRGHSTVTRRKRNILFPNGVKLCSHETVDQAVASHLNYFHLRVCQETVWEAFKIFWDRLPERDEYQDWVNRCINGTIGVLDIGNSFSQSEEHQNLIRNRVAMAATMNSVHTSSDSLPCSSETPTITTGDSVTAVPPGSETITHGQDQGFEVPFWTVTFSPTESVLQEAAGTMQTSVPVDLTFNPTAVTMPNDTDGGYTSPSPAEDTEDRAEVAQREEKVPDRSDEEENLIHEDIDWSREVSPEGEEPPSDVVVQEVTTEAAVMVLQKPTARTTGDVVTKLESGISEIPTDVVLQHFPEITSNNFMVPKNNKTHDSSSDIINDVTLTDVVKENPQELEGDTQTLEDPSEVPVEVSRDQTSAIVTPTMFLMTDSEEEMEVPVDMMPKHVSVPETEVPSQVAILTTTVMEISDVTEDSTQPETIKQPTIFTEDTVTSKEVQPDEITIQREEEKNEEETTEEKIPAGGGSTGPTKPKEQEIPRPVEEPESIKEIAYIEQPREEKPEDKQHDPTEQELELLEKTESSTEPIRADAVGIAIQESKHSEEPEDSAKSKEITELTEQLVVESETVQAGTEKPEEGTLTQPPVELIKVMEDELETPTETVKGEPTVKELLEQETEKPEATKEPDEESKPKEKLLREPVVIPEPTQESKLFEEPIQEVETIAEQAESKLTEQSKELEPIVEIIQKQEPKEEPTQELEAIGEEIQEKEPEDEIVQGLESIVESTEVFEPVIEPTQGKELYEEPAQELEPIVEPTQEKESKEVATQELELIVTPTQEKEPKEELKQELLSNVEPTQEFEPIVVPIQEKEPEEEPTQELEPNVEITQKSEPQEEPTQELEPIVEPTQEKESKEDPTHELDRIGELTQKPELEEEPTQELEPLIEPTQEKESNEEPDQEVESFIEKTQEPETIALEPTVEQTQKPQPTQEFASTSKGSQEPEPEEDPTQKSVPLTEQTLVPKTIDEPSQEPGPTTELTEMQEPKAELTQEPEPTIEVTQKADPKVEPKQDIEPILEPTKQTEPKEEPTPESEPSSVPTQSTKTQEPELKHDGEKPLTPTGEPVQIPDHSREPPRYFESTKNAAEDRAVLTEPTRYPPLPGEPTEETFIRSEFTEKTETATQRTEEVEESGHKIELGQEYPTVDIDNESVRTEGYEVKATPEVKENQTNPPTTILDQFEEVPIEKTVENQEDTLSVEREETPEVPPETQPDNTETLSHSESEPERTSVPPDDSEALLETTLETTSKPESKVLDHISGDKEEDVLQGESKVEPEIHRDINLETKLPTTDINTTQKTPLQAKEFTPEPTVKTTQATLSLTTKFILETNNGNFPEPTQSPYEPEDNLLGNNGFLFEDEQENSIGNEIDDTLLRPPRPLRDQVVEMRIKLKGESYNDALRDQSTFEYQQLARHFKLKVEDAFEKVPGFKSIHIIEFRPQKDLERGLVVQVHYAITVEVDSGGITNETLDFITQQNNLVERNYPGAAEQPTVIYTITDFHNYITEALHKDNFMINSSLETLENAANSLPPVKSTSRPVENYENMDNVLAAEKPPDAPSHEADTSDVSLKKEDFLLDTITQRKGPQSETVSENDVFMFEESTVPLTSHELLAKTFDQELEANEESKSIKDEGFLVSGSSSQKVHLKDTFIAGVPHEKTPSEAIIEDRSGSGYSGDDHETDPSWQTSSSSDITFNRGDGSLEVLPPPDLEVDLDDELVPTTAKMDLVAEVEDLLEKTTPLVFEESSDDLVGKPVVDQDVVTPELSTEIQKPTTQTVLVSSQETHAVEPLVQTVEASGLREDFPTVEPFTSSPIITASPKTESWTLETTKSNLELQETTQPVVKSESTEVIPLTDEREAGGSSEEGEITETDTESPLFEGSETTTDNPLQDVVLVEKTEPPLPETETQDRVEILEERHLPTTDSTMTTTKSEVVDRDMIVDEIMVVVTTAESPTPSIASVHIDVGLSPEKDSPFTRVSDSVLEEDEIFHQSNDDVTEVPISPPPSDASQSVVVGGEISQTEEAERPTSSSTTVPTLVKSPPGEAEPTGVDVETKTEEIKPPEETVETFGVEVEVDQMTIEVDPMVQETEASELAPELPKVASAHETGSETKSEPPLREVEPIVATGVELSGAARRPSTMETEVSEDHMKLPEMESKGVEVYMDLAEGETKPIKPIDVEEKPHVADIDSLGGPTIPSGVEVEQSGAETGLAMEEEKAPGSDELPVGEIEQTSKISHQGNETSSSKQVESSGGVQLQERKIEPTGTELEPLEKEVETSEDHKEPLVVKVQPSEGDSDGDNLQKPISSQQEINETLLEIQPIKDDFSDVPGIDVSIDLFHYGGLSAEGDSSGHYSGAQDSDLNAIALPSKPGRALTVFFSLRVTNMVFSMKLFNKSSDEYKALEQQFLQLLVPHLESNLNNFQNLEILNFRNGSIVVNSRMRFGKPVPKGVDNVIYLILEDFANNAYQTMNLAIDKYSLDVESGDRADPCKYQACNEFSKCMVNQWSGEAECVCDAGYLSVDGLPCQSVCEVKHDFCLNDGKCDILPGKGAICRCRVGENWWYRGEHCEEYVSEPLVVGIAIVSVAGFLLVAAGVIFFLARTLREQYNAEDTEDPIRRGESMTTLECGTKFNPMFDSEPVSAQCYRRYADDMPQYHQCCDSSLPRHPSKDLSSEDVQNSLQNTSLSKEEIQERLRIIELCSRDQHFADFVRQTQVFLERRGSSTT